MNELTKTLIYCACALVAVVAGVIATPRTSPPDALIQEKIGKPLFEFDDPAKAASLEIVEFDEGLAKRGTFKVARDPQTNAWTIPSHSKYPADADTQMRDASLALIDLKVLDVASKVASDHEIYGVVDPNEGELKASAKGVGKLAIVKDAKDDPLAEIVIGKTVKGSDGHRFVRIRGQEVVYVVKINPDALPTEFSKWIEKDLLQIGSFDIESLSLRDYSVARSLQGLVLDPRLELNADFDATTSKWQLRNMKTFGAGGKPILSNLLDEEELNTERLNEAKNALDQLEIVDVVRKPNGLGANLKASDKFMENAENQNDLRDRGFYVLPLGPNRELTITSANGEIHASSKNGVRYILRFGDTTGTQDEEGQLNRFLFVTVEVDETKIPKPIVEPLPISETPTELTEEEKKQAAENKAVGVVTQGEPQKISDPDELAAARERISKENARKVEEYKEKKAAAEKKVRELQQRFGDWYYVIANDVYKKVRLGRADMIKERAGEQQGFGVDTFRTLQEQGLEGASDAAPAAPAFPGGIPGGIPGAPRIPGRGPN